MRIVHRYSACISIYAEKFSILCDPWFTPGAYNGSWYHYPVYENALERLGPHDFIYISHVHPDHYDPMFLRQYLEKYPEAKIIIQDREPNFLALCMRRDGFSFTTIKQIAPEKGTEITIVPDRDTLFDIDSVLVVKEGSQTLINANDVNMAPSLIKQVHEVAPDPTVFMLGYQGASGFPQVYFPVDATALSAAADEKVYRRLSRYLLLCEEFKAEVNIPFAGQYMLGGRLAHLNPYRGNGDDTDVLYFDGRSCVLMPDGFVDLDKQEKSGLRYLPYRKEMTAKRSLELECETLDYEKDPYVSLTWLDIEKAFDHARAKAKVLPDAEIFIKYDKSWIYMNPEKGIVERRDEPNTLQMWEAHVDPRLLEGCIHRRYNWNNAYVGSQYPIRELFYGDDTNITAFLIFFHI